jgi:hypothetical protein
MTMTQSSQAAESRRLWAEFGKTECDCPVWPCKCEQKIASEAYTAAFDEMLATIPQTTAGAVELITAFLEIERDDLECSGPPVIPLLNTLRPVPGTASITAGRQWPLPTRAAVVAALFVWAHLRSGCAASHALISSRLRATGRPRAAIAARDICVRASMSPFK